LIHVERTGDFVVALGTTNKAKIQALQKALARVTPKAHVIVEAVAVRVTENNLNINHIKYHFRPHSRC